MSMAEVRMTAMQFISSVATIVKFTYMRDLPCFGFLITLRGVQSEDFKMGLLKPIKNQNHAGHTFK